MGVAFTIAGTGSYLPESFRTSAEIDAAAGRPTGWIERQFQIVRRGVAAPHETASAMGASAARRALDAAGWTPDDLDVIVGACGVMEQPIPGAAALIQHRLGLGQSGKPAFDVNATCLSFLTALDLVSLGLAAGRWRRALVVSADIASAALNFDDPEASVIFGDGAAAACVEAGEGAGEIRAFRLETYGDDHDVCALEAGGSRVRLADGVDQFIAKSKFRMDGPAVFRATARRYPRFLMRLLKAANATLDEIDVVIPHQASAAALEHLKRTPGLDPSKVVDIFSGQGNQIATSLPSALDAAVRTGRLKRGDTALLIGTAAGVSLGGMVLDF